MTEERDAEMLGVVPFWVTDRGTLQRRASTRHYALEGWEAYTGLPERQHEAMVEVVEAARLVGRTTHTALAVANLHRALDNLDAALGGGR